MLIGGNIIILKPSFRGIQKNLISLKKRLESIYSLYYLKPYNLIAKGMPSAKIWKTNFRWLAQSQSQWVFRSNRSRRLRPELCNNRLYSKTNKQYQTTTVSRIIDFSKVNSHTICVTRKWHNNLPCFQKKIKRKTAEWTKVSSKIFLYGIKKN